MYASKSSKASTCWSSLQVSDAPQLYLIPHGAHSRYGSTLHLRGVILTYTLRRSVLRWYQGFYA